MMMLLRRLAGIFKRRGLYWLLMICPWVGISAEHVTLLDQIMTPEMIGRNLSELEALTGSARKTAVKQQQKLYKVMQCDMTVAYRDDTIRSIELALTPECSFDFNAFIKLSTARFEATDLTFGTLKEGVYFADCVFFCEDISNPTIYELWEDPDSTLDTQLQILSSSRSTPYERHSQWVDEMLLGEGEDWLMQHQYNCHPERYQKQAQKAFQGLPIEKLIVGYDLLERRNLRRGCP